MLTLLAEQHLEQCVHMSFSSRAGQASLNHRLCLVGTAASKPGLPLTLAQIVPSLVCTSPITLKLIPSVPQLFSDGAMAGMPIISVAH
jgi:hypothetical protein